jgi:hypothetical protein
LTGAAENYRRSIFAKRTEILSSAENPFEITNQTQATASSESPAPHPMDFLRNEPSPIEVSSTVFYEANPETGFFLSNLNSMARYLPGLRIAGQLDLHA